MAIFKYKRWYYSIMEKASNRELEGYGERHHVKPRALGGSNAKRNIVKLTYREHFLAHWLLTKFMKGKKNKNKMKHALACMTRPTKSNKRIISGWQYEIAKKARFEVQTSKSLDEERRAKISKTLTGRKRPNFVPWNKNKKLPKKYRAKISATLTGRKQTEEHIANVNTARERRSAKTKALINAKISKTMTGRKYSPERRANISIGQRKRFNLNPQA